MRVAVVIPPSLGLPQPLDEATVGMADALRHAGHDVQVVDLGLIAVEHLFTRAVTTRLIGQVCERVVDLFQLGTMKTAKANCAAFDAIEPVLVAAPQAWSLLRDPSRRHDGRAKREALITVIDALGFYALHDPVFAPDDPRFASDIVQHVTTTAWSPLHALYDECLIDATLDAEPERLLLSIARPEHAAEAIRLARCVRGRNRDLHITLAGAEVTRHAEAWLRDGWALEFADSVETGAPDAAATRLGVALIQCAVLFDANGLDQAVAAHVVPPVVPATAPPTALTTAPPVALAAALDPPTARALPPQARQLLPRNAPRLPRQPIRHEDFGFRARLESHWEDIRDEWLALPKELLCEWPEVGAVIGAWGIFPLSFTGRPVAEHRKLCPTTAALLDDVPGLYTAGFSAVGPHSTLPLHFGEAEHLYRCLLPVVLPEGALFRVAGVDHHWKIGETLAFEDTLMHRAANPSDQVKVSLLVDFLKPPGHLRAGYDFDHWHAREKHYYTNLFPQLVS